MYAAMHVYRLAELKRLAEVFMAATGMSANLLSNRISGGSNNRMIGRLLDDKGIGIPSMEAAADWFNENWPNEVPWPLAEHLKERAAE
jgi:hypothetical protein